MHAPGLSITGILLRDKAECIYHIKSDKAEYLVGNIRYTIKRSNELIVHLNSTRQFAILLWTSIWSSKFNPTLGADFTSSWPAFYAFLFINWISSDVSTKLTKFRDFLFWRKLSSLGIPKELKQNQTKWEFVDSSLIRCIRFYSKRSPIS